MIPIDCSNQYALIATTIFNLGADMRRRSHGQ